MTHYIILTIGPVQSYISQARRTQDLWQGSRILSYLARVGVDEVSRLHAVDNSVELIYPPPPAAANDQSSIPNRIVIEYASQDDRAAREVATTVAGAIEAAWQEIATNTYAYIVKRAGGVSTYFESTWWRQVDNWLECYWVVVPAEPNVSYSENMHRASQAMGVRKLWRDFKPVAEPGRKCSVTGEHEALRNPDKDDDFWGQLREKQKNLAQLGQHERLSAIATIKRFAHERDAQGNLINRDLNLDERFPSTSSIATISFRYDVLRQWDALATFVRGFLDALETLFHNEKRRLYFTEPEAFPYLEQHLDDTVLNSDLAQWFLKIDGDYLFDDTYISPTIAEYGGWLMADYRPDTSQVDSGALQAARQSLRELIRAAVAYDIAPPNPYLVILSMDGDSMGKTLGDIPDKAAHQQFSHIIADFARRDVPMIVEKQNLGRVVYAGGDDVLAVLPVRNALQVADRLRSVFQEVVVNAQIPCKSDGTHCYEAQNTQGQPQRYINSHASAGLAYVHHTHNLQRAINAANAAQKDDAKKALGRDALAVRLLRRSGEPRAMGQKWVAPRGSMVNYVLPLVIYFADGRLSRNLAQDLQAIVYSMTDPEDTADFLWAARQAELERVLRRRLDRDKIIRLENIESAQQLKDRIKAIAAWFVQDITVLAEGQPVDTQARWTNAMAWIDLARFIAQSGPDEATLTEVLLP